MVEPVVTVDEPLKDAVAANALIGKKEIRNSVSKNEIRILLIFIIHLSFPINWE
jgi:hypothetical protein